MKRLFSLSHSRKIMHQIYKRYTRKKAGLLPPEREVLEAELKSLEAAILQKDKTKANDSTVRLSEMSRQYLKKTLFERCWDLTATLIFALLIAIVIRQMCFEFYTIPTGSMRPTIKEGDRLLVSKTSFGINTVTRVSHLYFDPDLVKRGDVVVFSVEGMNVADPNINYFYLFPGKKQFVKRLIAKPGDTIYFHGGRIYGIDSLGNEITEYRKETWFSEIEHIPFITFEGTVDASNMILDKIFSPVYLLQMNLPIAKLWVAPGGALKGEMLPIKLDLFSVKEPPLQYGKLWGMENFAMARLLTKAETSDNTGKTDAPFYLELKHSPSINNIKLVSDEHGLMRPGLSFSYSFVPLDETALKTLFAHLTTARFKVKDGFAYRLESTGSKTAYTPALPGVPDGCYEFCDGTALRVYPGGITRKLDKEHPLNQFSLEKAQLLYNCGVEIDLRFMPTAGYRNLFPSRYAYFRDGDLYVMGAPVLTKENPLLKQFLESEEIKAEQNKNFTPFLGRLLPFDKHGKLKHCMIRKFGLTIPDKMYLALGDNHAQSGDSRVFGFVPEANLRGTADYLFFPFGSRFGHLPQPAIQFWIVPHMIVWPLVLIALASTIIVVRRRNRRPLKF